MKMKTDGQFLLKNIDIILADLENCLDCAKYDPSFSALSFVDTCQRPHLRNDPSITLPVARCLGIIGGLLGRRAQKFPHNQSFN